jgi:hypothetical protein
MTVNESGRVFRRRGSRKRGVFKKRLSKNRYRSIVLAKGGHYWVFEYLFAKQDRANIEDDELGEFRKLAKIYETLAKHQVERLIQSGSWMEICNDGPEQVED